MGAPRRACHGLGRGRADGGGARARKVHEGDGVGCGLMDSMMARHALHLSPRIPYHFPLPPSPFPLPRHSALLPSPLPLLRLCLFSVRRVSCVLAGVCGVSAHGRCSCHPGLSYRARFADLELAVALEVCSWRLSVDPRRTRACG
jgi:hypothetical protein